MKVWLRYKGHFEEPIIVNNINIDIGKDSLAYKDLVLYITISITHKV